MCSTRAVGVFGDVEEHATAATAGRAWFRCRLAERGQLLEVDVVQRGHHRLEVVGDARGAALAAAATSRPARDRGPWLLRRARQDPHRVPAPLERLAGPRLLQHLDAVLHERRPALDVEIELLVLLGPVARTHRQAEPPLRDEVEHREIFGEADRVVQRQEHDAHADQHALGDRGRPRSRARSATGGSRRSTHGARGGSTESKPRRSAHAHCSTAAW